MDQNLLENLPRALLPWYDAHRRDLPWREDREPYHVWLSEIMLQQTRVEAVKGYYARFLNAIADIATLANADDELLHKLWEGLGYYSRVRNLKKAAQVILQKHDGIFPDTYDSVLALPGIGAYTAGAILSICYNQPVPAVDGNVLRVVSRILNDDTPIDLPEQKKKVTSALAQIYPERAGDFTQALMELGATLCGPNWKPRCEECPCASFCQAHLCGTAEQLPVKSPKKQKRVEEKTVFILSCEGEYGLRQRPDTGLLAGLWEFPNVSGKLQTDEVLTEVERMGLKPKEIFRQVERKHIFTHIRWELRGVYLEVVEKNHELTWFTEEQINARAALPTAFRQFWEERDYV